MSDLFYLQALYVGVGLLLTVLSIPMVMRRIKPNLYYGFRVPKAYKSDAVWYEINAYSGKRLCIVGILIAAVGLLAPFFIGNDLGAYISVVTVVIVTSLGVALLQSFLYLNTLTK
jgi:uncharacterized membrane protein